MSNLDLDFNEDQQAIANAVAGFCSSNMDLQTFKCFQPSFNKGLWCSLAELGVFTPATSQGEGGALEICAISESLGRHVFPGPIASTYLAAQLLESNELEQVLSGQTLVSVSSVGDTLLPWGMDAGIFFTVGNNTIYRTDTPAGLSPVETLGGEPWARITTPLTKKTTYQNSEKALLLNHLSTAAYLSAAGMQLVKEASDYANTRKQFGKTLGEFQGVAHPLADCQISLTAAQQLARAAACAFDNDDMIKANEYTNGAKLSANRAALKTAYVCHQTYAAIGITLEGPAFHYSRRIRQMATQAPNDTSAREQLLNRIGLIA